MSEAADKLMRARCRLMTREPWYGHMAMSIEWKPSEMGWVKDEARRTIGMKITSTGVVQAFYNPQWVENTDLRIIFGVIEHAINHLIRLHTLRTGGREEEAWNLATDMAVNGAKRDPYIGYLEEDGTRILPDKDMVFVPQNWPVNESAEKYYEMLNKGDAKQKPQSQPPMAGGGDDDEDEDGQGGAPPMSGQPGQDQNKKPGTYSHNGFEGKCLDDHEAWNQSDISEDEARQIVHDMAKEAADKSQGHMPGHLKQILEALSKPVVRWRELLRQFLGTHVGNRRPTYSRANRRRQEFGFKGVSRHAASTVSVIVDTSGSISDKDLEQFFAEIEAIAYRAKVFVLQWDHAYQGYARYRRGDWKRITVNGRGGTDMAAPVDWLEKNSQIGSVMVMLTDGYCQWPHRRGFPALFCITTDQTAPDWGTTIRMKAHD